MLSQVLSRKEDDKLLKYYLLQLAIIGIIPAVKKIIMMNLLLKIRMSSHKRNIIFNRLLPTSTYISNIATYILYSLHSDREGS